MRDGFIKVAAITPKIKVADCIYNSEMICRQIEEAYENGAKILVFPELCVTGYTCGDLFWQEQLLGEAKKALYRILAGTRGKKALVFVGLPWEVDGKLYNVAAACSDGRLLGLVPKRYLPSYNDFYEARNFYPGKEEVAALLLPMETECGVEDTTVMFGMNQVFVCPEMEGLAVAVELGEDLWVPVPPSTRHALAGANVIANLSASVEVTGKSDYRTSLVSNQSARLLCGYIYASAGEGESTQDAVFSGHNLIAENGTVLSSSPRFSSGILYGELDIQKLRAERRRMTTFESYGPADEKNTYVENVFALEIEETKLTRKFDPKPFVPEGKGERERRCEEIFMIQAMGLKKRLEHINCKNIVVGISGGLDSTLALLVMVKAFDLLGLPRKDITAVTMPCFGTTNRTYNNACLMTAALGCTLREINIKEAVSLHFRDIGHDPEVHNLTFENSQARERTQILMDVANEVNGLVIGTGDMSELALGWATYNGDHMSMYGVNCSVPKTLVRHLVRYYADTCKEEILSKVLYDVLDTPVSPELLPPKDGEIAQITEDLVGPYELHDFFLYNILRFGYAPMKVYRIAKRAFEGVYEEEFILKWLKTFYWRFFAQQFKRSCVPDGPKVGSVAMSPRGDLRMPSDACVRIWREELDRL